MTLRLVLLLAALAIPLRATEPPAAAPAPLELERLDQTEEHSEELAASLIEAADAFQQGDDTKLLDCLLPDFVGDLPFAGTPSTTAPHPGYEKTSWPATPGQTAGRDAWAGAIRSQVSGWRLLEDARIKVRLASFSETAEATGQATLLLKLEGLGPGKGERVYISGWLDSRLRRSGGRWRLASCKTQSLSKLQSSEPPFVEVTRRAGMAVSDRIVMNPSWVDNFGSGAAAIDFDSDGLMDLVVLSRERNYLYRNEGDGGFSEVAEKWGILAGDQWPGVIALDADNDGREDLFIGTRLWRNTGTRFELDDRSPLRRYESWASSAAAADYDNDGLLDVYVCRVQDRNTIQPRPFFDAKNALPNLLLRNTGGGKWQEMGAYAGVDDTRWSMCVAWADYDRDGLQDVYVCNDRGDKTLYRNLGTGKFQDVTEPTATADNGLGMGIAWGDYDNDGDLDVYLSNMFSTAGNRIMRRLFNNRKDLPSRMRQVKAVQGNTLLRLDGAKFSDATQEAKVAEADWAWGTAFVDVDNDGWLDLFVTNGFFTGRSKKDT